MKRNIDVWLPLMLALLGTWPTTQAFALTGNRTDDPLVGRLALNPLSHTSQGFSKLFFDKKRTIFYVALIIGKVGIKDFIPPHTIIKI